MAKRAQHDPNEKLVATLTFHGLGNMGARMRKKLITWLEDAKNTVETLYDQVSNRYTAQYFVTTKSGSQKTGNSSSGFPVAERQNQKLTEIK